MIKVQERVVKARKAGDAAISSSVIIWRYGYGYWGRHIWHIAWRIWHIVRSIWISRLVAIGRHGAHLATIGIHIRLPIWIRSIAPVNRGVRNCSIVRLNINAVCGTMPWNVDSARSEWSNQDD